MYCTALCALFSDAGCIAASRTPWHFRGFAICATCAISRRRALPPSQAQQRMATWAHLSGARDPCPVRATVAAVRARAAAVARPMRAPRRRRGPSPAMPSSPPPPSTSGSDEAPVRSLGAEAPAPSALTRRPFHPPVFPPLPSRVQNKYMQILLYSFSRTILN